MTAGVSLPLPASPPGPGSPVDRWRLFDVVDGGGLGVVRLCVGAIVAVGAARFLWSGWPEILFGAPTHFFRPAGFAWVPLLTVDEAMRLYTGLIIAGTALSLGLWSRLAAAVSAVLFGWAQLQDVTNYLNHYWLLWLLLVWLAVFPSGAALSLDAWWRRRPGRGDIAVPRLAYGVLRAQVGVVYVFAAVAKVGADWLLAGQPLGVWLPSRSALPLLGPWLEVPWVALALSWGGLLYDFTIVPLLLCRRTRIAGYLLVVVFHALTWSFFSIGFFPVIMIAATTIFFDPDWPRQLRHRLLRRWHAGTSTAPSLAPSLAPSPAPSTSSRPSSTWGRRLVLGLLLGVGVIELALPLRHHVLGDDVLWDEAGMRLSWRVMVREKSGSLTYRVRLRGNDVEREVLISPHEYLTWRQVNEMIGQPDLILQLAHIIDDDLRARGHHPVHIAADSLVTLNGRPPAPLVDPTVNLLEVQDCFFCRRDYVLPAPTTAPPSPWRARGAPATPIE